MQDSDPRIASLAHLFFEELSHKVTKVRREGRRGCVASSILLRLQNMKYDTVKSSCYRLHSRLCRTSTPSSTCCRTSSAALAPSRCRTCALSGVR